MTEILIYKYFKILRSFFFNVSQENFITWSCLALGRSSVRDHDGSKNYFDKSQFLIYHAISPFLTPEIKRKEIFTSSASFPCSLSLSKFSIAKTGKLG